MSRREYWGIWIEETQLWVQCQGRVIYYASRQVAEAHAHNASGLKPFRKRTLTARRMGEAKAPETTPNPLEMFGQEA